MTEYWPHTQITKLLHLDFPIIQAPMAGCSTPELVTSICYAGGLGSLGAGYMSPKEIQDAIRLIRLKTKKRFMVNLYCFQSKENQEVTMKAQLALNPYRRKLGLEEKKETPSLTYTFEEQLEVVINEKVPVVSFSFGLPSKQHIQQLKNANAFIIGTATNLKEVQELDKMGFDAITLQGAEAGGHRATFIGHYSESLIGLVSLIPEAKKITHKPLIAAGGIMNAQQITAALLLGAHAVQLGTAFLGCTESGVPYCYKQALFQFKHHSTTITNAYSGRVARVIQHPFLTELGKLPIADFPFQNMIMQDVRNKCAELNKIDFIPLYAGQGFPLVSSRSALEIFYELAQSTSLLFKELKQNPSK
jgi:nitronate monooxygenase